MSKRNNSLNANKIPDIDGLKIINRLPGWEKELDELIKFLIGPTGDDIENYYLYKKAFKCCYNKISIRWDADEIIKDFAMTYAKDILSKYGFDEHGNPVIVNDKYDPKNAIHAKVPPFINYLTNEWMLRNRFNSFWKKQLKKISQEVSGSFTDDDGNTYETIDSNSEENHADQLQRERSSEIYSNLIIPYFLEHCDDELKTIRRTTKQLPMITFNHIMAVFQLYPQIIGCEVYVADESKYQKRYVPSITDLDSSARDESNHNKDSIYWFECYPPFNYDKNGLGRAVDMTFERSKKKKPNVPPEKALYECHTLSRRYGSNNENQRVESLEEILDHNFAPIDKSEALERFSLTAKHKSIYLDWVLEWFCKNTADLQQSIKINYPLYDNFRTE